MPELPEVEHFRQILLPLVDLSRTRTLSLELVLDHPPRKWRSTDDIVALSNKCYCVDVRRRGKLLCMVLECLLDSSSSSSSDYRYEQDDENVAATTTKYLYLHMGMTGRVTAPGRITVLENVKDDGSIFPPPYTYLLFKTKTTTTTTDYRVAFCDPRKFSSCQLSDSRQAFQELAPDALEFDVDLVAPQLAGQSMGIKSLLLDQKRAVSGVGNWVADELCYQLSMHPDQTQLSTDQARALLEKLQQILALAIDCLNQNKQYPDDWLFNYRWTKKKAGNDHQGRPLTFVKSGGRTSVIVASMQQLTTMTIDREPRTIMKGMPVGGTKNKRRIVEKGDEKVEQVVDVKAATGRSAQRRRTTRTCSLV